MRPSQLVCTLVSDYHSFINRKTLIGGVLVFVMFVAAIWTFPTVAMIALPMITLLVPEDEEYGNCTIIKSKGAYAETELLASLEQVCGMICMDAQADSADDHDILCQFESESVSWERPQS